MMYLWYDGIMWMWLHDDICMYFGLEWYDVKVWALSTHFTNLWTHFTNDNTYYKWFD